MLTVALVVMVIFVFLRTLSATIIPSVAVPLSLVGTFAVMYLLGYSLNNLTLMALTISTGFVVDDAIVMIENIVRYIEAGDKPLEAALKGAEQIGFTIISLTVSLVAVLIPLLFMGDIVGRLFREFAVTLAVTILVSAVVSLTLTPMMCSRLLRAQTGGSNMAGYTSSPSAFSERHRLLRADASVGSRTPAADPSGRGRDTGPDRCALYHRAKGILPGAGHGCHSRHFAGARRRFPFRRWPPNSRRWPRSSSRTRRSRVFPPSLGWMASIPRSTAAAFSSISNRLEERKHQRLRRHEPPAAATGPRWRALIFTCSRCRT